MIDFVIDVRGVPVITNVLRNAGNTIERAKQRVLTNIGLLVQRTSRRNAPFKNGDLERSIVFRTSKDDGEILVPSKLYIFPPWV